MWGSQTLRAPSAPVAPRRVAACIAYLGCALLCAAALAPPAGAAVCEVQIPGDNSSLDQYAETIPGSCELGDGSGVGAGGDQVLSRETASELERLGPDGAAAAALARATAPETASGPGRAAANSAPGKAQGGDPATVRPPGGSGSAVGAVEAALVGDGGAGPALPLGLGAILLVGLGLLLIRRKPS